jgi:hypothetical protein
MTQFEMAIAQAEMGNLETPIVSTSKGNVDYFWYQLSVHHFNLKILAKGMKFRNVKLSDLKNYYGLKGRSAADCLNQFESIIAFYRLKMINDNLNAMEL